MAMNYPVGDFLIRAKNAAMAGKREFSAPKSKFVSSVAQAIVKLGYFEAVEGEKEIKVVLRYHNKRPLLSNVKIKSRPGLRNYMSAGQLSKHRGVGVLVVSTPQGVMGHRNAVEKSLGGEVIAEIL